MGRLTTHVLDTASGSPASGVEIKLYRINENDDRTLLLTATTNSDGRCDGPLLDGAAFKAGRYQLVFGAGQYFARGKTPSIPFLDDVIVAFGVADAGTHYHVPLLISPYGYTTYRGS
eukprot:scpid96135/ scgid10678/ 5-hydroxyisourate hydrolase 2